MTVDAVLSPSQFTVLPAVTSLAPGALGQIAPNRETIYQALQNHVAANVEGIKNLKRRSVIFSDMPPDQQPAIFLEQIGETPEHAGTGGMGLAYKWELSVMLGLYVFSEDPDKVFPAMNPILDAIEAAFPGDNPADPAGHAKNLGGLVYWVRLGGGELKPYSGAKGGQGFAYVPLSITTW